MKLRRSVGAEVNWGIRFTCEADADSFLEGLAGMYTGEHTSVSFPITLSRKFRAGRKE